MNKHMKINLYPQDYTKPGNFGKLEPWQITGLTDGEGSFGCSLSSSAKAALPSVKLEYKITQKSHSEGVLHDVVDFYSCGSVTIDNRETDTKKYRVSSLTDIQNKIIPHFQKYPCLTSKHLNFQDWVKIADIMIKKEHLTLEGVEKIKSILSNLNKNRSFEDKYNFCKAHSWLHINEGTAMRKLPAHWVQTYIASEGTFYNYLTNKLVRGKPSNICDSSLEIAQNSHDVFILLAIKDFFNGGYIKPKYDFNDLLECKNSRTVNRYVLRDTKAIIEFVDKYPMLTRKQFDYLDWKNIVELKNSGAHKTEEGFSTMKKIFSNMNSSRM